MLPKEVACSPIHPINALSALHMNHLSKQKHYFRYDTYRNLYELSLRCLYSIHIIKKLEGNLKILP